MIVYTPGLRKILAGETRISHIQRDPATIIYRGYDFMDFVNQSSFEELIYLFLYDRLPNKAELQQLQSDISKRRTVPSDVFEILQRYTPHLNAMELLRLAISLMPAYRGSSSGDHSLALDLIAQTPVLVAAIGRMRQGLEPVAPEHGRGEADQFLYMLHGKEADKAKVAAYEASLICLADHEFNASTFAARVTAATRSDLISSVITGINALKGPLHGGANEAVMMNLLEIGDVDRTETWVQEKLKIKQKVIGFGHSVYRTKDPRAIILQKMSYKVAEKDEDLKWVKIAEQLESIIFKEKQLYPNVDLYSAPLFYSIGIPVELFTPIFVCARMCGWTVHIMEQYENNKLIRPDAQYTGHLNRTLIPLEQRTAEEGKGGTHYGS